jgi:Na+/H+-dicarboxylate symporter/ABC-type amino acid transport substrate-binding protein
MTVLPYVTVSIITSLGSLSFEEARRLGAKAGLVLVGLWTIALGFTFLFPLVFPESETASFFSASLVPQAAPFNFVDLYIPSNPFHSLANNVVPAVVLFSVIFGLALIGIERKTVLLDVLSVAGATIARATRFIVRLTPYGIFAMAATAAGTLDIEELERIQVYLVTYVAISLLVALWVLPGLVAALTPIRYREVFQPTRDALITAFMAGDLFIVLPILIEACKGLLVKYQLTDEHTATLPDVIVPASFNFPHTGKLLSLSFILFAGWFADATVPLTKYPQLALTGLLTFFGSLNAAVPFLLDIFRIPVDTFQLFLATGVINSRFGTLAAAVHTVTVALLGSAAIVGAVRFDPPKILRYLVITLILTVATVGGLRLVFATLLAREFKGAEIVYGMTTILDHNPSRVVDRPAARDPAEPPGPVLEAIRARGVLRVGFLSNRLPFAFRNVRNDLVGLDVELAHLMSRDLGVEVEFTEFKTSELFDAAASGLCDLGIGGTPVTPERAVAASFSDPYIDETLAFVVRDHLRNQFETWASIRTLRDVVIGVPPLPYYEREIEGRLPGVPWKPFDLEGDPLGDDSGFDAIVLPAERGSVLTMINPKWTVVVPEPDIVKIPIAFPLARHDPAWNSFVNTWIELKRRDGTLDALYNHWILGQAAIKREPRWSVIRNVLHWVD